MIWTSGQVCFLDKKGATLRLLLLCCLLCCSRITCQLDLFPSQEYKYEANRTVNGETMAVSLAPSQGVTWSPLIVIESPLSLSPSEGELLDESVIPPIFVVNLDRAVSRWQRVSEEIDKAGLGRFVHRLSAVDGKAIAPSDLCEQTTLLARMLQPRGVLGCYLSHRKFWSLVVEKNLTSAIVLEDDVRLVDNFKQRLIHHLQELRNSSKGEEDYDVILLGAIGRVDPDGRDGLGPILFSTYYGGTRPLRRFSESFYQPVKPAGTHGYIVSLAGAKKLLTLCPKAVHHVDLDAWRHPQLKIRMFSPMLVFQTFEDTTLTDLRYSKKTEKLKERINSMTSVQRLQRWAKDPVTQQPVSHFLSQCSLSLDSPPR